ncbi:hypothetical protein EYF80_012096 [Liparis tanakae]|uniref:Uncharacterized protein n=1 Tax=Liparis tanakae TaxID=230148 RepID=A0A4Z2IJ00_9TELE|nr:hypothetical protein EYF80_012096 [Liparis tanakae]
MQIHRAQFKCRSLMKCIFIKYTLGPVPEDSEDVSAPISSLSLQRRWLDLPELVPEPVDVRCTPLDQEGVCSVRSDDIDDSESSCRSQPRASLSSCCSVIISMALSLMRVTGGFAARGGGGGKSPEGKAEAGTGPAGTSRMNQSQQHLLLLPHLLHLRFLSPSLLFPSPPLLFPSPLLQRHGLPLIQHSSLDLQQLSSLTLHVVVIVIVVVPGARGPGPYGAVWRRPPLDHRYPVCDVQVNGLDGVRGRLGREAGGMLRRLRTGPHSLWKVLRHSLHYVVGQPRPDIRSPVHRIAGKGSDFMQW